MSEKTVNGSKARARRRGNGMKLRYQLAAAAAAAGGACLLRSEYERNTLAVDHYEICSPKILGGKKTFVFLTDLHDKEFGEKNERLIKAVREAKPDAVLCGGDMMVAKGKGDLTVSLGLLGRLAAEFPVFCGNGNHEVRMRRETETYGTLYRDYRRELAGAGVVYLADSAAAFGNDVAVYGLDLEEGHYLPGNHRITGEYLNAKLGNAPKDRFSILLAHSPVFFEEYAEWGADLTLAGHFHGGTIRLPVLGGVMTPQYQFFYPRCAGMFSLSRGDGGTGKMIVGRGLGTHTINIRLNNKPQVVVVTIKN